MSKFIYNTLGLQTNEQKQKQKQKQQQIEQGIEPIELSNDNSRFDVIKKMYNIIVEFNKKYNINLFDAYPKIDYLHIKESDTETDVIEKNNKYKYPLRDQLSYDKISYVAFIKYNTANRYELDFTKYDYNSMSSASAFYPIMKTIHEKLNNNNNDNNDNSTIKNSIYHLLDNAKTNKLQDIREAYHERLNGSYIREIEMDSSKDKEIRDELENYKIHDKFESSKIYTIFAILSCVYYYNDQKDRDIESYTKFINQIENTEYSSQQGGKRKTNRKNIKKNKSTKKIHKKSRKTHKKRKN